MTKFNNLEEYLENKKQMLIEKYGMKLPATITGTVEYWGEEEYRKFLWIKGTRKVKYTEEFKIEFGKKDTWMYYLREYCSPSLGYEEIWSNIYLDGLDLLEEERADRLAQFLNNLEQYYIDLYAAYEEHDQQREKKHNEAQEKLLSKLE